VSRSADPLITEGSTLENGAVRTEGPAPPTMGRITVKPIPLSGKSQIVIVFPTFVPQLGIQSEKHGPMATQTRAKVQGTNHEKSLAQGPALPTLRARGVPRSDRATLNGLICGTFSLRTKELVIPAKEEPPCVVTESAGSVRPILHPPVGFARLNPERCRVRRPSTLGRASKKRALLECSGRHEGKIEIQKLPDLKRFLQALKIQAQQKHSKGVRAA
jgi:hypothetical protein